MMHATTHREPWHLKLLRTASVRGLTPWLVDSGSLTARLKARYPSFRVQVLYQGLRVPFEDERVTLGLHRGERAWVREVLLCDGNRPLVFAHSVLPRRHVVGAWNLFAGLGARPLGEVLFTDRGISRQPLRFKQLNHHHPLHQRISHLIHKNPLHARRSLFFREGKSLLVTEVFLPQSALF
jgi:chorismate--pyruvate lyase